MPLVRALHGVHVTDVNGLELDLAEGGLAVVADGVVPLLTGIGAVELVSDEEAAERPPSSPRGRRRSRS